jgi:hypothetical protein
MFLLGLWREIVDMDRYVWGAGPGLWFVVVCGCLWLFVVALVLLLWCGGTSGGDGVCLLCAARFLKHFTPNKHTSHLISSPLVSFSSSPPPLGAKLRQLLASTHRAGARLADLCRPFRPAVFQQV